MFFFRLEAAVGKFHAIKDPCEDLDPCTIEFATPVQAIETYHDMVEEGIPLPDIVFRVNALFTKGVWSEEIPEEEGWTIEEPTTDETMSLGVNLATQEFVLVTTKEDLPPLYIDTPIQPETTTGPSTSMTTTATEDGPTCESDTSLLVGGDLCIE